MTARGGRKGRKKVKYLLFILKLAVGACCRRAPMPISATWCPKKDSLEGASAPGASIGGPGAQGPGRIGPHTMLPNPPYSPGGLSARTCWAMVQFAFAPLPKTSEGPLEALQSLQGPARCLHQLLSQPLSPGFTHVQPPRPSASCIMPSSMPPHGLGTCSFP